MSYDIVQGKITQYTNRAKRICQVLQIPDHYIINEVRIPRTLMTQALPQEGSFVLVATEDSYRGFVLVVLREPTTFIGREGIQGLRASSPLEEQQLQPGEIFLESRGDTASPVPGTGATFFMGNDGTITLHSGKRKESITIGGSDDDDDGEIIIQCDNGFFESSVNEITFIRSIYRFDESNNLKLGNILTDGGVTNLEIPISELTMDTLGNTVLRNTIFGTGVSNASLSMTAAGTITLENTLGSLEIDAIGQIEIKGTTINLNNGTFGAARLNDLTLSNTVTDPIFWTMPPALQAFMITIAALVGGGGSPVTQSQLGAIGAAFVVSSPLAAISLTGKINTASSTVKIGG